MPALSSVSAAPGRQRVRPAPCRSRRTARPARGADRKAPYARRCRRPRCRARAGRPASRQRRGRPPPARRVSEGQAEPTGHLLGDEQVPHLAVDDPPTAAGQRHLATKPVRSAGQNRTTHVLAVADDLQRPARQRVKLGPQSGAETVAKTDRLAQSRRRRMPGATGAVHHGHRDVRQPESGHLDDRGTVVLGDDWTERAEVVHGQVSCRIGGGLMLDPPHTVMCHQYPATPRPAVAPPGASPLPLTTPFEW